MSMSTEELLAVSAKFERPLTIRELIEVLRSLPNPDREVWLEDTVNGIGLEVVSVGDQGDCGIVLRTSGASGPAVVY